MNNYCLEILLLHIFYTILRLQIYNLGHGSMICLWLCAM